MNDVASALLRGDETGPCNRDQTKRPLNIRLITVVWGAPFVDVFTRVCLRSLLAEGNIFPSWRATTA